MFEMEFNTNINQEVTEDALGEKNKAKRRLGGDDYYYRPPEANRKMRMAYNVSQTVWIKGVCGSGKTSFVADYLKNKKYVYYTALDTAPSEIVIPDACDKKSIIVIDDLYGISDAEYQNAWYEVIEKLVEREDIWTIMIARSDVPSWLHTLSIEHAFFRITMEDLCFSKEQAEEYLAQWGVHPSEETSVLMWTQSQGHPLFYKIAATELSQAANQDDLSVVYHARDQLYQYLDICVYSRWRPAIRDAFLKLSILGEFDLEMAVFMTNNSHISGILKEAMEIGDFIRFVNGQWSIMVRMRESMMMALYQEYDTEYVNGLIVRAGDCFRIKGKLMEALALYEKAGAERSIVELLVDFVRDNMSSGQCYELRHYLLKLPDETVRGSLELMAAMSMLQSIIMNEEESEYWYHELEEFMKRQTGAMREEARMRLLFLDIGLPHRGDLNSQELLAYAGSLVLNHKMTFQEFSVTENLPSQMNGGKDFASWSRYDTEIVQNIGTQLAAAMGKYGRGLLNLAIAESRFEKGEDYYEVESYAIKGRMEAESGGKTEQIFVSTGILAWTSIFTNRADNAMNLLNGFEDIAMRGGVAPQLLRNLNTFKCRVSLYQGRTAEINEWMKEAPDEYIEFYSLDRFRYLTKIRVYLADCKYEEANALLQKVEFYAEKMKRYQIQMECRVLKAILYFRMDNPKWQEELQEAVRFTEEYHFARILSREGVALLPLLKRAELKWQDQEFRKRVMSETEEMAKYYPAYLNTKTENAQIVLPEMAKKILILQSLGKSNEEIAKELDTSLGNVKYHNKETYKKLGVNSKAHAVTEARNRKLI